MTRELNPEQKLQAETLIAKLCERFPKAFFLNQQEIQPLKVDIHFDLHTALTDEVSKKAIRRALKLYTRSPIYREKLALNVPRVDLEGNECGVVTKEHVDIACKTDEKLKQKAKKTVQEHLPPPLPGVEPNSAVFPNTSPRLPPNVTARNDTSVSGKRTVLTLKKNHNVAVFHKSARPKMKRFEHQAAVIPYPPLILPEDSTPLASGRLEINIKISSLPTGVRTIKNGWREFVVNADGQIVFMRVRPRIWNKLEQANTNYTAWIASITGKMGQRMKNGFELAEPNVQVFERKLSNSHQDAEEPPKEENGTDLAQE